MGHLDARGVDVARILIDAHAAGAGVDQAVAAVTTAAAAAATKAPAPAPAAAAAPASAPAPASADARVPAPAPAPGTAPAGAAPVREAFYPWAPPALAPAPVAVAVASAPVPGPAVSDDARRSWGPLTEGLKVPLGMNLGDRAKALPQMGVEAAAHAAMVGMVREVLPEHEAGLLIGARHWPLLAARMQQLGDGQGQKAVGGHLARLGSDTSWKQGAPSALVGRLVEQTHLALTTPPPGPVSRVWVSPGAARSRSTTASSGAAPGQAAAAEAAVPAHGQVVSRVKGTGRAR
ncbi:hypothetical protein OTB20_33405 [Streptomyces sp. H27-H1]|uniref:hypothetical protein n=1 Tax=Streptomyces sp. H27-H1 TaxID=2996461 RepID=UPI00226FB208|nr:hypothetical protein [Streptomyces sp. H27-H1]MCY0931005.1 hypothetical protein [Streptomyces sp. H27-H1]